MPERGGASRHDTRPSEGDRLTGFMRRPSHSVQVTATAFAALFAVVGLALYGLPLYYDFMVRDLGWSRKMVTSGNALSKLAVGPAFGFVAGWIVDRFGPRRLMMAGIVMAGGALIGLGASTAVWTFYVFYFFNALGYVCGGPLPNQVLLSQWFDRARGKAMGIAYLGIGIGGALSKVRFCRSTNVFSPGSRAMLFSTSSEAEITKQVAPAP